MTNKNTTLAEENPQAIMESVIGSYESLETRYERLRQAYACLLKHHAEFERVAEGVMMTDAQGDIMAVNPAFTQITGYSANECIGRNPRFLHSGLQDPTFYRDLWTELRKMGTWRGQLFNRKKSGEVYSEWLQISAARDARGQVISYTGVFYQLPETAPPPILQTLDTLAQPLEPLPPAPDR